MAHRPAPQHDHHRLRARRGVHPPDGGAVLTLRRARAACAAALVAPLLVAALGACAPESDTLSASGSAVGDGTDAGQSTGTHAGGGRKPAAVVKLEPTTFAPEKVQIEAGKRVLWKWAGGVQHNVNGGEEFKSELQSSGEFGHVFEKAGTYEYVCDVHPTTMKGTVEVVGAVEASTTSAPASSSTDY